MHKPQCLYNYVCLLIFKGGKWLIRCVLSTMNPNLKLAEEEVVQDIQENLERAKQELSECGENLMRDLELRAFADLYGVFVPIKKREESAKVAREVRDKFWNDALKKAKGDKENAFRIWAGLD